MDAVLVTAIVGVALALAFDFTNGYNDSGSLVATMVASHALRPRHALALAATFEFLGPLVVGTAVANTIGSILVQGAGGELVPVVTVAIATAILWNVTAAAIGMPASSSHALVGGLVGAGVAAAGTPDAVDWGLSGFDPLRPHGVLGVALVLLVSPVVGFLMGFVFLRVSMRVLRGSPPRVNRHLRHTQIVTAAALAFSHGANDAQKAMGVITLLLVSGGWLELFVVPLWVKLSAATMISAGVVTGGGRIMKTLGSGIFRIRPVHGLSSQLAAASVILASALAGGPVSTTHVVSSSIMGVGAGTHRRRVRWGKVREIVITWVVTIPATCLLAALLVLAWKAVS